MIIKSPKPKDGVLHLVSCKQVVIEHYLGRFLEYRADMWLPGSETAWGPGVGELVGSVSAAQTGGDLQLSR